MYVATRKRHYKGKEYTSSQIVEGYRDEKGRVRQRTLVDISKLGPEKIAAVKAALQGKAVVDWEQIGLESLDFGIVYVVQKILQNTGLLEILEKDGEKYTASICAMIANRIDEPCAKYSLSKWAKNTAAAEILKTDEKAFSHKACYKALDFLSQRQQKIEEALFEQRGRTLRLFFYDITSTYFEGEKAEQAAFGYSRDKRGDRKQIVIGLVTGDDGLPLTVEVFKGNTKDSTTVEDRIDQIKRRFLIKEAVFVADRGMRTKANIKEIQEKGFDFIMALNHREVLALVERHGAKQMSLFDKQDVAEVTIEGRRLIVCFNPIAAADTKRRRCELMELTTKGLEKIKARVNKGRLKKPDEIRRLCDKLFFKFKTEKFFFLKIQEGFFEFSENIQTLQAAARLDGVYVIETSLKEEEMSKEEVQSTYKRLAVVERAFRTVKSSLKLRPVFHYKKDRIKGHVFVCFLAYLVEQTLRLGLSKLPEDERPEFNQVMTALKGWHKIVVTMDNENSRLKPKFSGFTPEIASWLNLWHVSPPV